MPIAIGAVDLPAPYAETKEGLLFREPWEARAFAIAVALTRSEHIAWEDFRACLIAEIESATAADRAVGQEAYYRYWFEALMGLAIESGFVTPGELRDS